MHICSNHPPALACLFFLLVRTKSAHCLAHADSHSSRISSAPTDVPAHSWNFCFIQEHCHELAPHCSPVVSAVAILFLKPAYIFLDGQFSDESALSLYHLLFPSPTFFLPFIKYQSCQYKVKGLSFKLITSNVLCGSQVDKDGMSIILCCLTALVLTLLILPWVPVTSSVPFSCLLKSIPTLSA